jgi:hypothetical protein
LKKKWQIIKKTFSYRSKCYLVLLLKKEAEQLHAAAVRHQIAKKCELATEPEEEELRSRPVSEMCEIQIIWGQRGEAGKKVEKCQTDARVPVSCQLPFLLTAPANGRAQSCFESRDSKLPVSLSPDRAPANGRAQSCFESRDSKQPV